jgi:hypothetical protein
MFCRASAKKLQDSDPRGTGIEFGSPEYHIMYIWAENVRVVSESPELRATGGLSSASVALFMVPAYG